MILIRYDDDEYYIAKPISDVKISDFVFISGYETFGKVMGYANKKNNLIEIKGESTYFSVSKEKLYEVVGSTKIGFTYSLNKKDLDFQFGLFTPKEVIQFYLEYCNRNKDVTIDDFNNLFFKRNKDVINIEEITLDKSIKLKFGDVKPMLY